MALLFAFLLCRDCPYPHGACCGGVMMMIVWCCDDGDGVVLLWR